MKNSYKILASSIVISAFCACSQEEMPVDQSDNNQSEVVTRSTISIESVVYIEVNDINPLNAGSYIMDDAPFSDCIILFAANVRDVGSDAALCNSPNVQYVLDHKDTLVKPFQDKGIKVLLGLLGGHTGLGFANVNSAQTEQFTTAVANAISQYGLDGVDFDDEWAEYGRNGYPSGSTGSFSNLIIALHNKVPGKTITVFNYDYTSELTGINSYINYGIYAFFNSPPQSTGLGMLSSKFAPYTINLNSAPSAANAQLYLGQVASKGYGAIGYHGLRANNIVSVLNGVTKRAFKSTCTYDGGSYPKNY